MWIALAVAGALSGLLLLIAAIGACLPRDHRVTRSAVLHRSPAEVFAVIVDFAGAPAWRSDLRGVRMLAPGPDGRTRFVEDSKHGKMLLEVEELRPPERLVTRIADDSLPFGGRWIIEVAPAGPGTRVTVTEAGFVRNPVFRFLSKLVFGHSATLEAYLVALGRRFGEAVRPEAPAEPGKAVV